MKISQSALYSIIFKEFSIDLERFGAGCIASIREGRGGANNIINRIIKCDYVVTISLSNIYILAALPLEASRGA